MTKCRMIYQNKAQSANVLVSGNPEGRWFIMHLYINEIYNQYWTTLLQNRQENN